MKKHSWILAAFAACAVTLSGCDNSSGSAGVDPSPIQKSFATAEAGVKSAADTAVSAIKSADYSGALANLQKLAGDAKLTDAQKKAVADTIDKVKKAMADMASKASDGAKNAMGGLPKSGN